MSLENFKKCISTNLISLCGYLIAILTIYFLLTSNQFTHVLANGQDPIFASYAVTFTFLLILKIIYIAILVLFFVFIVENDLDEEKYKYPKFLTSRNKFSNFLFWLGYVLIPFPFYCVALIFTFLFICVTFFN